MSIKATAHQLAFAASLSFAAPAMAGQTCEPLKLTTHTLQRAMNLAQRTETELNRSGARVVLIARMGQNLSQYRVSYSHLGFAHKTADGLWRVTHKLNTCNTNEGHLHLQGLGEFFLDDLYRYEAGIVPLRPEVEDKLLAVLNDPQRVTALHEPSYSMLGYAWATRYQQSNQWAIETLASALEPSANSRAQAQAWLQFKGYKPAVLRIGPLTRLGARVSRANIAFDDHPSDQRYSDRIATATADSVMNFVHQAGLSSGLNIGVTDFGLQKGFRWLN